MGAWLPAWVTMPNLIAIDETVPAFVWTSPEKLGSSCPCLSMPLVIGTDTDRSGTYDLLLTFHINHGPVLYRFQDIARYWTKIANFPTTPLFISSAEGLRNENDGAIRPEKVWCYVTDIRTEDTRRWLLPRLRIASRGTKKALLSFSVTAEFLLVSLCRRRSLSCGYGNIKVPCNMKHSAVCVYRSHLFDVGCGCRMH